MSETVTVIAAAFAKAGYVEPRERLGQMMNEAITAGKGLSAPSIDHFVAELITAGDFALVWELCASVRMNEIRRLFAETMQERRKTLDARADQLRVAASSQAVVVGVGVNQPAPPATTQPPLPSRHLSPAAPGLTNAGRLSVARVARLSWLDRVRVKGRSVGDCTVDEIENSAVSDERDARFKRLLVERMTPGAKCRDCVTAAEADDLYQLAEAAANG